MERLDKAFSSCKIKSRTEITKIIRSGNVSVNGVIVKNPAQKINTQTDEVLMFGNKVEFKKFVYIMLNKPNGVISASEDGNQPTVIDILPPSYKREGLFPCGRLDKDTVGLVIITDDGVSAHKRLSPKNHAEKVYYFEVLEPVSEEVRLEIEKGVLLKDGYLTKPCKVELLTEKSGNITLTEGKYHEIKRIFGAKSNKITYLKRISFAGITLCETLKEGEARYLTQEEEKLFIE
jgi:16S rRNA pseudouridine516 synthase